MTFADDRQTERRKPSLEELGLDLLNVGKWECVCGSYLPHVAEGTEALHQTRLFRGRVLAWIAFDHLYHLEHHLYPQVPHHRWAELAQRLDPYFAEQNIPAHVLWR